MMRRSVILALSLAGCAAPRVEPVVTALSDTAPLGLTGAPAPRIADEWWRAFGDPQLDRVIADALATNPTLDAAIARVRQAQATLAGQDALTGPSVTLDGQAQAARLSGRYTIPPPFAGSLRTVWQAQANLSWNLDLFGRQRAAIEGARAAAGAFALDAQAARLNLAGSIVQTYIDMARWERQAAIARSTIATREGSLRLVNVQVRNQLASKLDTTAAQTLVAQARAALVSAEGQRALSANALAAMAGRGADYAATLRQATLRLDAVLPVPATLPADLLGRRADVAAARARIAAAAANRQVARRAYYPNVNLAAFAGLQAIGIGNVLSLDAGTAGIGPAISLPLFDNGRLRADLEGATAAVDLASAQYNDIVIGAVREAADGVALAGALDRQRVQQRAVVRGFAETNRLNGIRVASGLNSRLDLVDNDVRLLDAELADANLAADAARARVALVLALGGGFDPQRNSQP